MMNRRVVAVKSPHRLRFSTDNNFPMMHWSFDPVGGWLTALVALLALAPLLAVGPDRSKQSARRRVTLALLRGATLLLLMALLLRPAIEYRTTKKIPGTLVVLSDASRSMSVADGPAGKTRYAAMQSALAAAADSLAKLGEAWTIRGYSFGAELTPLKFTAGKFALGEAPTGSQTALGAALDDVLARESQQRIVAVVLLSDGAQRAFAPRDLPPLTAARRLGDDGVPLYAISFGQPSLGEQSDLRLSDLQAAESVFAETPTTVEAVLSAAGFAHQQVTVRLLWESADGKEMKPVDARKIELIPGKTRYPIKLSTTPRTAGEFKATIEVESPAGELVTSNNAQSTFISVLKGGVQVLYLAGASRVGGAPGIEPRFVRAALAANPDLHVQYEALSYRNGELDLRDRLREEKFDVFLLGDVDSSALSTRTWREMALQVERGAALAMLGGFHSFGPGGFQATPLAEALPVEMGRTERQRFTEPPRADVHVGPLRMLPVEGRPSPIMRLAGDGGGKDASGAGGNQDAAAERQSLEQWRRLPSLDGANRLDRLHIKPTAEVVAEGDDPSRSPLLIVSAYGAGRTAALAVDSTWHWSMEGFGEAHRRFWRQFVLWLARKDDRAGRRVWVKLDQRRYQQGSRVDLTLGADDEHGQPIADAEPTVKIDKPDGTSEELRAVRRGPHWAGSFAGAVAPGDYRVTVAARRGGESLGDAAARFSISDQDVELDQPAAEPLLMKSLAEATAAAGGAPRAPEELSDLLKELAKKTRDYEEDVVETTTLWDRWPTLLTFVGLLSAEWFLRQRWGLV